MELHVEDLVELEVHLAEVVEEAEHLVQDLLVALVELVHGELLEMVELAQLIHLELLEVTEFLLPIILEAAEAVAEQVEDRLETVELEVLVVLELFGYTTNVCFNR
jgi:hypothetical protein